MSTNSVDLIPVDAEQSYNVRVGPGVLGDLDDLLAGVTRVAIIHPPVLAERATRLADSLPNRTYLLEVPDGEEAKSVSTLSDCWDELASIGLTRSDVIVGYGGGSTTDLAGFVAATWLRGVRFVTVPTTVLAMVDAAVGGKTGINISAGKNLVGAFHEPIGVLCDPAELTTLDIGEIRSGLAEVIKCGFIADPPILDLVTSDTVAAVTAAGPRQTELIRRAITVKARVVSGDLRETDAGAAIGRAQLNYGHTLGHAIEQHEHFQWRHGEAISVGMVFAAEVARRLGTIDDDLADRHREVLESVGLPTRYDPDVWPQLRETMALDKKNRGTKLRLVVLQGPARPALVSGIDEALLAEAYAATCA